MNFWDTDEDREEEEVYIEKWGKLPLNLVCDSLRAVKQVDVIEEGYIYIYFFFWIKIKIKKWMREATFFFSCMKKRHFSRAGSSFSTHLKALIVSLSFIIIYFFLFLNSCLSVPKSNFRLDLLLPIPKVFLDNYF